VWKSTKDKGNMQHFRDDKSSDHVLFPQGKHMTCLDAVQIHRNRHIMFLGNLPSDAKNPPPKKNTLVPKEKKPTCDDCREEDDEK